MLKKIGDEKIRHERQADLFLQKKLMKEARAILAWLVRGCIRRRRRLLDNFIKD